MVLIWVPPSVKIIALFWFELTLMTNLITFTINNCLWRITQYIQQYYRGAMPKGTWIYIIHCFVLILFVIMSKFAVFYCSRVLYNHMKWKLTLVSIKIIIVVIAQQYDLDCGILLDLKVCVWGTCFLNNVFLSCIERNYGLYVDLWNEINNLYNDMNEIYQVKYYFWDNYFK